MLPKQAGKPVISFGNINKSKATAKLLLFCCKREVRIIHSREYWRKREEEALKKYKKSEAEYDKEIERIYKDMVDSCNKEINSFYAKYAKAEKITLAEAKKRVRDIDIKEYERKAAKYVRDASLDRKANGGKTNKKGYYFSEQANKEMKLYNLTMKVNRLEMLKANIGIELIKSHDELEKFMAGILKGRAEEELRRQAGILGKTIRNNARLAHTIPNASFHNATFSDRIWLYQDLMREDLGKLLASGLIRGKNPRVLARELEKFVIGDAKGGAKFNVERLMRTELARVQTEAQKQSYIHNGFKEYEFIANSGCCDICKALDGKHFKVKDMMPGENAPPIHPLCRCSTAAYEDSAAYDEWLDFISKGGTTAEYNELKAKDGLTKINKGAIIAGAVMGALNNKNDPDGLKRQEHAEKYYLSMRNSEKEGIISAISKNSNIDSAEVAKMFEHLIINQYDLDEGHTNFAPDYYIAESIRRLREGKNIQKHDKILVLHEALEYELMNEKGLSYEEAHNLANKKHNYQEALDKWLDEQER